MLRKTSAFLAAILGACSTQSAQLSDAECAAILARDPTSDEATAALAGILDRMAAEGGPTTLNCTRLAARHDADRPLRLRTTVTPAPREKTRRAVRTDALGFALGGGAPTVSRNADISPGLY